jgi:putative membrane protein
MTSLKALPSFLGYLAASIVLLGIFLLIYTRITRHDEWSLIRQGNCAAAVSLSGALLGFSLPLASVIAHAANIADLVVWALVAMVVQLLAYLFGYMILRDATQAIDRGEMSAAVVLAAGGLVMGVLNAACLTY